MKEKDWYSLYEKSKDIESKLPQLRKELFEKTLKEFPDLKYKNFSGLKIGFNANKLTKKIISFIKKDLNYIEKLKNQAIELKKESDILLEQKRQEDTRKTLNPKTDIIPFDLYPKLKNCDIYPLRENCNYGENDISKWERCEYMKYDNTKSIHDEDRWICTYSKN